MFWNKNIYTAVMEAIEAKIADAEVRYESGILAIGEQAIIKLELLNRETKASQALLKEQLVNEIVGKII